MYIQITTRCNMSCAHCCFRCTSRGRDMSMGVFRAAVDLDPDSVVLGGGEPTLHPKFNDMLLYALSRVDGGQLWMATNGSVTDTAIVLAKLARQGVLGVALSVDEYHDPIDPRVVRAFTEGKKPRTYRYTGDPEDHDFRELRNASNSLLGAGRAIDNELVDQGADRCPCPGPIVKPGGAIRACGCLRSPIIGNAFTGVKSWPEEEWALHRA